MTDLGVVAGASRGHGGGGSGRSDHLQLMTAYRRRGCLGGDRLGMLPGPSP